MYGGEESTPNFISDCLSHEDECDLTTKANTYAEVTSSCVDETILCANQVSISISSNALTCTASAETNSQLCNCKYPAAYLTNNSEYVNARINVKTTFSGHCSKIPTIETTEVEGGCTLLAGCSNANKSYYSFGFNSNSFGSAITGSHYITSMRVYTTDSTGVISTMYNLNLNPSTSPYLADHPTNCNGCSTVLSAELLFGHANFSDAFATLMDNVSIALFGDPGLHGMSA